MSYLAAALSGLLGIAIGQPPAATATVSPPKLSFIQDGKDLLVSMTVEVPDAPYVVWTHASVAMRISPLPSTDPPRQVVRVDLSYELIQSRDDPAWNWPGKTKKVEIAWRLTDHEKGAEPYRVIRRFEPSAVELKELAPKLAKLAEETERRQRDPKLAP